jgi:hypothetical protein
MGAVHRNVPHAITRVPCLAPAGSIVMVNFSTGGFTLSDFMAALPRSRARL